MSEQDPKSTRLGTMVHTIANELVNHYGKKLDREVIDEVTRNLTLEMCQGPTAWAFSGKDQPGQSSFGPALVKRDEDGWWEHPDIPDFDDDSKAYRAWIDANRLEIQGWSMEDDSVPDSHHYWAEESCSCTGWDPQSPGPEWFLLGIFDAEDGPYVQWGRFKDVGQPEHGSMLASAGDAS